MTRGVAIFLSLISVFSLVCYGANPKSASNQGQTSVVIVFKDGHKQTFRMADIAHIEFSASVTETHAFPAQKSKQPLPGRNHFIGKWEVGEGNGNRSFYITLNPDGHAEKSIGASHGTWALVDGEARITWDDGWHDAIRKIGSKHEKFAYEPSKSFTDSPANVTEARATDPKPL